MKGRFQKLRPDDPPLLRIFQSDYILIISLFSIELLQKPRPTLLSIIIFFSPDYIVMISLAKKVSN